MSNLIIEKATEYIGCGLSVIPVKSDKSPAIRSWSPYQNKSMVTGEIQGYFSQQNVNGIGIVCGEVSANLEVIDVDLKYDKSGLLAKEFPKLIKENLPEVFKKLVVAKTINKGLHLLYRCDVIEGNQKLAKNKEGEVLIETRGEGGYIVASPTPGYEIISSQISEIPTITKEERELLFLIARSFDETEGTEENEIQGYQNDEESTFGDYNLRADVLKLVMDHGWTITGERPDSIYFKRPGKQGNGVSASWHIKKRVFFPFTTSTEFQGGKGYSPTGVYTVLECKGDYSLASRKLSEMGYGVEKERKYNKSLSPIPPFPISGFPEFIQFFIDRCHTVYQTPKDFWAISVLAATALGIGDKLELKTKYSNIPILWSCIVGDVSTGKTEAQKICLQPFYKLDEQLFKQYIQEIAEYKRLSKLSETERLAEGVPFLVEPKRRQYLLNDYTPEALAQVHAINKRGLMIERDELKGWLDDFNRYNKSGEQSFMLSTFSRVSKSINRKGSGDVLIQDPVILILGGIQPDLLPTLAVDNRAENGFLSRMCFCFPDNTAKPEYSDNVIPEELLNMWEKFILDLTNIQATIQLTLSDEAKNLYMEWFNKNRDETNNVSSGYLKGVFGKLDIISLRIAIVIKGMKLILGNDISDSISDEIMKSAIEITEYFRATALKVYHKIFLKDEDKLTEKEIVIYLYQKTELTKLQIANYLNKHRMQVQRWTKGLTKNIK